MSIFTVDHWTLIDVPEVTQLPQPLMLYAQTLPPRHGFPLHVHNWHQFIYATSGTLVVHVQEALYVITPEQGIWVPQGTWHTTGTLNGARFRSLCLAQVPQLLVPPAFAVYAMSPLLKALIIELDHCGRDPQQRCYQHKIHALIYEQLCRLKPQEFRLPWPRHPQLQRLCESLYANPSDTRSLGEWGQQLGACSRTLLRHFERETGLTMRAWRQKLRLFLALEWIDHHNKSITQLAMDLGYASPSAFTSMFKTHLGLTPGEWRKRQANRS